MKRELLLLAAFVPFLVSAQPEVYNDEIQDAGVQSVSEYHYVNGKRQLERFHMYDDQGRQTLTQVRNRYSGKDYVNTDTSIFYDDFNYTRIAFDKNDVYDSITWHKSRGYFYDTIVEQTYHRGKIVLRSFYLNDSLPQIASYQDPIMDNSTGHLCEYKFDDAGRITEQHEETYSVNRNVLTTKMRYGYYATYNAALITQKHYTEVNGQQTPSYLTFRTYNGSMDSCIMLKDDGSIEYTFVMYKDVRGNDSLSVMHDPTGKVINRNYTVYDKNSKKTEYHDESGAIWKTLTVLYNKKGMVVSATETYHKTGEVSVREFEYTYF